MLSLDRLTRRFGDVLALDGVSFDVEPGQMFGFVGSNGAGKTTAMRIVMGVDDADSGEVRFDGDVLDRDDRIRFGYMPEERGLYPKTSCVRQLTYLGRLHGMSSSDAAQAANRWLDRLGLGERKNDHLEKLSLGNQQRVQLAAALVHDPALLVLDEPFSSLDPTGVDALSEILLERAAAGVPVVFSSHQLELVERLCDAVAIIDAGRIVATGTVDDLRTRGRPPVYRVLVDGHAAGWAEDLEGVRVLTRDRDGTLVELGDGVDSQIVLAAAQRAGAVQHFAPVKPTLAELYREVVARTDPSEQQVVA